MAQGPGAQVLLIVVGGRKKVADHAIRPILGVSGRWGS